MQREGSDRQPVSYWMEREVMTGHRAGGGAWAVCLSWRGLCTAAERRKEDRIKTRAKEKEKKKSQSLPGWIWSLRYSSASLNAGCTSWPLTYDLWTPALSHSPTANASCQHAAQFTHNPTRSYCTGKQTGRQSVSSHQANQTWGRPFQSTQVSFVLSIVLRKMWFISKQSLKQWHTWSMLKYHHEVNLEKLTFFFF